MIWRRVGSPRAVSGDMREIFKYKLN
jgi:hypothetical protein